MINRKHIPLATCNYKLRTMCRILLHCVISAVVAILCTSVNVNGEVSQVLEKVVNKTSDYKSIPLQTTLKQNNSGSEDAFIQSFKAKQIQDVSTIKLKSLSHGVGNTTKVQYKRHRKPYRRRRKFRRRNLSRKNLRFIRRYQDIQNDINILNSYPNYRRG